MFPVELSMLNSFTQRLVTVFFVMCVGGGAATAAPTTTELSEAWANAQSMLGEHAHMPVQLTSRDFEKIATGEVLRRREKLEGTDRALGATWTSLDRDAVWVAILDDTHDTIVDGLTERRIASSSDSIKLLFQHIELPWPFEDRQWIIQIENNPGLFQQSGGQIWERTWKLAAGQEKLGVQVVDAGFPAHGAVWTPLNQGGWLLLEVSGGTLMIYHARADIGGVVPDDVATRYAVSTLRDMFRHILDRAVAIPGHHRVGHEPTIHRPDGSVIAGWTP